MKGTFGEIYQAEYLQVEIAVKKIHSTRKIEIEEFKSEAELIRNIPIHPNVVSFLGITISPLCIISEYYNEGSLFDYLHSNSIINDDQKIKFSLDIAKGMVIIINYFIQIKFIIIIISIIYIQERKDLKLFIKI